MIDYTKLDGWFDFAEVYDLAVKNANQIDQFVETGTYKGKSAAYMDAAITKSGKQISFVTVDIVKEKECQDLESLCENVTQVIDDSLKVAGYIINNTLGFVFLDADHSFEFVSKELEAWWPKVRKGGIFAGHDYDASWPGVVMAVQSFAAKHGVEFTVIGSSWVIYK